jgi:hypothetical protein
VHGREFLPIAGRGGWKELSATKTRPGKIPFRRDQRR